jgi:seryl-tRNA synthetase
MTDDHGHPETEPENSEHQQSQDPAQTLSLNTNAAAQQLGVDSRTVRRYITDGLRLPGGDKVSLVARQVRSRNGEEWQIYQSDLEKFKEERDRAATEGHVGTGQQENQSQALTTSIQIISTELERRSQALVEAQQIIERLSREAGQYAGQNEALQRELEAVRRERSSTMETIERLSREAGRNEALQGELEAMRQRLQEMERERNQWQQKAQEPPQPRRIRLLPWQKEQ